MEQVGALGDLIFIWAHRMNQNQKFDVGILIHAFESKVWPFEVFPYVCTGTCVFAKIYTSIETSPNVCIRMPYLLKVLCREPACIVYCRAASGYVSYKFIYTVLG